MRPLISPVLLGALAALTGCIQDASPPNPGKCALAPDGRAVYTWGEVQIGTCLAGPADLEFFEQKGKTFLAVSNANPYIDFSSGSFLVIDWDSVDLDRDLNLMHEVKAGSLGLDDYLGGFGLLRDRKEAIVTGRISNGDTNRSADDRLWMLDLERPLAPTLQATERLTMRDDPFPVVVDEVGGRAYVGNLTDHSVAVFDITVDGPIEQIDVAPGTVVSVGGLDDADGSGSNAVIQAVEIINPSDLKNDSWTLDWVEGTARIWSPVPAGDNGEPGLQRYTDVGIGPVEAGITAEVDPTELSQVFGASRGVYQAAFVGLSAPFMYFVDLEGTRITRITSPDLNGDGVPGDGPIGDWDGGTEGTVLLGGGDGSWDAILGGPAVEVVDDLPWLFYDGRASVDAPPALGFTIDEGLGNLSNAAAPFLDPADHPDYVSFEHPTAWHDISHDGIRVWMTATKVDGSRVIGLTESRDDGETWSAVEEVFADPAADVLAPVVEMRHGRFQLWFTRDDGTAWTHATAWSWDGRSWFDETELFPSDLDYDPLQPPPRLAVQSLDTSAWSLEGRDSGPLDTLVTAGTLFGNIDDGYAINVAHGHEILNSIVPDGRAEFGLRPGSLIDLDGIPTLYVTEQDDSRTRIGVLQQIGGAWVSVGSNLIPANTGGNKLGVSDPVVFAGETGWVMYYAATSGLEITRIRKAVSTDGLTWTPESGDALTHDDDWDGVEQRPHSVRLLADGGVRLWYAGGNGSRLRIGSARANRPGGRLTAETGLFDPWRFEPGIPGSFDDGGVRDPLVYADDDGQVHLIYAGFDGADWSLGHAELQPDNSFARRIDPVSDRSLPSMPGILQSFSSEGVHSPVLVSRTGEELSLLYAGTDGLVDRIGRAVGRAERQWPAHRFPTVGDQLDFTTEQGRTGTSVIELAQSTETFLSTGIGMSGLTLDADRGMLYVPSKLESYIYVLDVRDDTGGTLNDANALDVEGVVAVSTLGSIGFRDVLVDAPRDRLYLTSRNPDGVVVMDLTRLVDDDTKDVNWYAASSVLPLQSLSDDAGATTVSTIGGAGMTLTPDGRYLLVAHHRGNGVAVFDLEKGAWGSEVAWLADVGENPHQIVMSPDGRYAVVANYVGEILDNDAASSTLAVIDMDPESDSFLEVVTWLANR